MPGGVVVTPKDSTVYDGPGLSTSVTFTVQNTRLGRTQYSLVCSVTAPAASCSVDNPTITLDSLASAQVLIDYTTAGTLGTGRVQLKADTAAIADSGWVNVVVEHPVAATLTQPRQNDSVFNRGHCLTTRRGPLTWSCGDAMYFLETPGFTTLDRDRSMTLVYASNTAAPAPIIAANVTMPSAPAYQHMYAVLRVDGTMRTHATYNAWTGSTRQIALSWDALSAATGAHPYTLTVYTVSGSDSTASTATSGLTTVVNRSASPYGNGWAWLGVERLILSQPVGTSDNDILWVDGDGSTRLYHPDGSNKWISAMDDGQDSIAYASSQYTLTTRHGVQVIFDNTGRHIQTKNRAGQITTFAWVDSVSLDSVLLPPSGSGKAFKVLYTSGRMSGMHLDGSRDIVDSVVMPSGTPPELSYWKWPDGTTMQFGYESHHRLTYSVFSGADYVWLHYDTLGLVHVSDVYYNNPNSGDSTSISLFTPWQEVGFDSNTTTNTAGDTAGVVSSFNGPPVDVGRITTFQIDQWGAPTYMRDPYGFVTLYRRNDAHAPGLVSEIDYPAHRKTFMQYDSTGRGHITRLADSTWGSDAFPKQVTTWAYTDANDYDSPSAMTPPDGTTTSYTYNALGLTASVTDPRSHTTAYAYNTSGSLVGQLTSVTEESVPTWIDSLHVDRDTNLVTTLSEDALGNPSEVDDPAGGATRYGRDGAGRVTALTNPVGFVQHFVYDSMDRVTRHIALHSKGAVGTGCHTAQFTCDSTLILDALNPFDTDTSVSPADSEVTKYFYSLGRVTAVVDPRGVVHQYNYDQRGLLIRNIDEAGKADTNYYDEAGRLVRQRTRQGDTLTFAYDLLGRETQWTLSSRHMPGYDSTFTSPRDTITSTYDSIGNLLRHHNSRGTIARTYDANGVMRSQQDTSSGYPDSLAYTYNARGELAAITWSRGDQIAYGYSGTTGDLDSVTASWAVTGGTTTAPTILLSTDAMGRRRMVKYQTQSMADTIHYDALGVIRKLVVTNRAGPSGPSLDNRFDVTVVQDSVDVMGRGLHRRVHCDSMVTDTIPGVPCGTWAPYETSTRYNRVGDVAVQSGLQFFTASFNADTFRYDRSGNRRSQVDLLAHDAITFDYRSTSNRPDSSKQNTGFVNARYYYDSAGSRQDDMGTGLAVYQYDAAERMAGRDYTMQATFSTAPDTFSLSYEDVQRAPNSCHYDADGQLVTGCGVSVVSHEGNRVVREHDGDWWCVVGPGLDDPLLIIKRGVHGSSILTDGWYPVVSDGRGQIIAVADTNGEFQGTDIENPQYQAGLWNSSGLTGAAQTFNPRRQAMPQSIDTVSTFRTRQYDPATGKWLQEDHAGLGGGTNLYEYNGNDPNSFSDPFGLCNPPGSCVWAGLVAGGAAGAATGVAINAVAAVGTAGVSVIQAPVSIGFSTLVGAAVGGTIGAAKEISDAADVLAGPAAHAMGKISRAAGHIGIILGGLLSKPNPAAGDNTINGSGGQTEFVQPGPKRPGKETVDTSPHP